MEAPLTTATASLSCPRCEHDLRSEHHQAGNTHACFRCGGLFLEGASLKQATLRREVDDLAELSDQIQIAHIDLDPHIPCPCCRVTMERGNVGGVDLDRCRTHGIWFDQRELVIVAEHLRRKHGLSAGKMAAGVGVGAAAVGAAAVLSSSPAQRDSLLGSVADAGLDVADVAVDLVGDGVFEGAFELIFEVIGGLFSLLGDL
jgi:Zn-finger nucleic acid-binding protein